MREMSEREVGEDERERKRKRVRERVARERVTGGGVLSGEEAEERIMERERTRTSANANECG